MGFLLLITQLVINKNVYMSSILQYINISNGYAHLLKCCVLLEVKETEAFG